MSSSGDGTSNVGGSAGNALKQGITKIHGIGEAIRGNINTFADSITNTDETKSRSVTQKGTEEIQTGKYQGTGAGVTPADTAAETANKNVQGEVRTDGIGGDSRFADGRFVK